MNPYLLAILGYSALLIVIGLFVGRGVKSTDTFFVAGRNLGPLLLFATLLAANIGAGSTMGAAGIGYARGLVAWWWVGSAGIGTLLLAFWAGPRVWRLAKEHDLQTVGDLLELRYGGAVRGVVAALLWVTTLFVLAAQLIAVAIVLQSVAGIPKIYGCLIGGVVVSAYFAAGGLLSSAWVNLVQLVVLTAGFVWIVPAALDSVGGFGGLSVEAGSTDIWQGGGPALYYMALLVPAFIISPGLVQKVYGARDERTVRIAVGAAGLALMVFAFLPVLPRNGCARSLSRAFDAGISAPDLARSRDSHSARLSRARGHLLGGSELGGRGPLHARDVTLARSLSALRAA